MLVSLAASILAIVAGIALSTVGAARAAILLPLRSFAMAALLASVVFHLLPEAIEGAGAWTLLVFAAGLVLPSLASRVTERFSTHEAHRALVAVFGVGGVLLHQIGDGLALGAFSTGLHADHIHWDLVIGIAAHTLPVAAVVMVPLRTRRAMWGVGIAMVAATLVGVALASAGSRGVAAVAGPWLNALVAGVLLHILAHDTPAVQRSLAVRSGELLAVAVGASLPFWAGHDEAASGAHAALADHAHAAQAHVHATHVAEPSVAMHLGWLLLQFAPVFAGGVLLLWGGQWLLAKRNASRMDSPKAGPMPAPPHTADAQRGSFRRAVWDALIAPRCNCEVADGLALVASAAPQPLAVTLGAHAGHAHAGHAHAGHAHAGHAHAGHAHAGHAHAGHAHAGHAHAGHAHAGHAHAGHAHAGHAHAGHASSIAMATASQSQSSTPASGAMTAAYLLLAPELRFDTIVASWLTFGMFGASTRVAMALAIAWAGYHVARRLPRRRGAAKADAVSAARKAERRLASNARHPDVHDQPPNVEPRFRVPAAHVLQLPAEARLGPAAQMSVLPLRPRRSDGTAQGATAALPAAHRVVAWGEALDERTIHTVPWLLAGAVVAGLLAFALHDVAPLSVSPMVQVVVGVVVAVPVYMCAVAMLPVAVVLLAHGVAPVAVLAAFAVGPLTNRATWAALHSLVAPAGRWLILGAALVFAVLLGAIAESTSVLGAMATQPLASVGRFTVVPMLSEVPRVQALVAPWPIHVAGALVLAVLVLRALWRFGFGAWVEPLLGASAHHHHQHPVEEPCVDGCHASE